VSIATLAVAKVSDECHEIRVFQDLELTKIAAIKSILRLFVEEIKTMDPFIAFSLDFAVILIEMTRSTPGSEEIWNF